MTADTLDVVVPGPITQRTGGYIYDARMVDGLRTLGWHVRVHEVAGRFPDGGEGGERALRDTLAGLADGGRVLTDGLAVGALPGPLRAAAARLRVVALVHHPLGDETGLETETRERLLRVAGAASANQQHREQHPGARSTPRSLKYILMAPTHPHRTPQKSRPSQATGAFRLL